ncbi:hypothetical protein [Neolewinella agarilytica]|uniref:6-bladed beta-propeller protein n=1 Tax=Neolewinella agarilytica TaxID=478744 RepID=A0A1H9J0H6_9BACT|nr:hypothetical protein [Neolewinella agarilytica]SEQ80269.1 hypothetical protein SAMN05444359_11634 [Neolewinella agarilytica]
MLKRFAVSVFTLMTIVSCQEVVEENWIESDVVGISMKANEYLFYPEIIKQTAKGGYIILDEGHKSPILNFDSNFKLISKSGVKGNGPLQIEGFRDVVPSTNQNDTTYLIDMYGDKIICYDKEMNAVDSRKLDFNGRPAFTNFYNDSICVIGYRGCNTMARLVDRRTMRDLTKDIYFAPPKNEGVSIGASYDLYESFSVYNQKNREIIFFPIYNIDDVLIYDESGRLTEVVEGPARITPKVTEADENLFMSSRPDFSAYQNPVKICGDYVVVGYSGLFQNRDNSDFYSDGQQLLVFSLSSNRFIAKVNLTPVFYFIGGAFDCDSKVLSLLGNRPNEDGKEVYNFDLSGVFNSLKE